MATTVTGSTKVWGLGAKHAPVMASEPRKKWLAFTITRLTMAMVDNGF